MAADAIVRRTRAPKNVTETEAENSTHCEADDVNEKNLKIWIGIEANLRFWFRTPRNVLWEIIIRNLKKKKKKKKKKKSRVNEEQKLTRA